MSNVFESVELDLLPVHRERARVHCRWLTPTLAVGRMADQVPGLCRLLVEMWAVEPIPCVLSIDL